MSEDQFHQRGQILEDMFFYKSNQALLDQLKQELADKEAREQLSHLSGITDEKLLSDLVAQRVRPETLACVTLIPLVVVAWADGKLDEEEKLAIMRAVREKGLSINPAAVSLIDDWLKSAPGDDLFETWEDYIKALAGTMTPESYAHLKSEVIGQAKRVAHAAGGFLGIINSESQSEKRVLEKLEEAFA